MDIIQIIDSTKHLLNNKIKSFDTSFYNRCIEHLNDPDKIQTFLETHEINHTLVLEPLRLYVDSMFDNYVCFITDVSVLMDQTKGPLIRKNSMIRDLSFLSIKARDNLLRQLYVIETEDLENFLEDDVVIKIYPKINQLVFIIASNKDNKFNMNLVIDDIDFIPVKNKSSLHLLMGKEVLRFLEKQDLDRFVNYMKSTDHHVVKSTNMFKQIFEMNKNISSKPLICDRMMMFSGFVMHSLGTSYTGDADMMYWAKNLSHEDIQYVKSVFSGYNKIELFIYDDKDTNLDYVGDLITDPEKHYYFVGIKILCIKSYLRRLYMRGSPSSFVDLLMLNRINNIRIKPCIPVITTDEEDKMVVYTKKIVEKKLRTVQKYFKEWHNMDFPMNEIRGMIKQCKNYPNDPPFYRSLRSDPLTQTIEFILNDIILILMNQYFVPHNDDSNKESNRSKLLIIDDAKEYPKYYPSKRSNTDVVIIEPENSTTSKVFMKMTEEYFVKKEQKKKQSYVMIQGDIRRDNEFNKFPKIQNLFRFVMFKYNICFMMNQINNVIDNLANKCTSDVKIMILYIDGDKIEKLIGDSDRSEVFDDTNQSIFGVYRYDDQYVYSDKDDKQIKNKQVVIFLRETLRYGYGVIERLTNSAEILDAFGTNYDLIIDEPMIHYNGPEIKLLRDELTDEQKKIAMIFRCMILQRKDNIVIT